MSGYDGDIHYTGSHYIAVDSPGIGTWIWVQQNRKRFPAILSQQEFHGIERVFENGTRDTSIPGPGYYFISAEWSGPAQAAKKALLDAHSVKPLPRPIHCLDIDSDEPGQLFPHLVGLISGAGELFSFNNDACDFYMELGSRLSAIQRHIEFVRKWE